MRKIKILKLFGFLAAILPFTGVACSRQQPAVINHTPKYLLNGTLDSSDSIFSYYSIENDTAYAVALKEDLISSTTAITIPSTYNNKPVTGIWRSGFFNSHATSFTIPDSITVIDYEAFMGSRITNLTIPASVSAIGEGAFYYCKNLTKASIQNSTTASDASSACSCVEAVDNDNQERTYSTLKLIPAFCFFNCYSLKELMLPESIEEIGCEAFNGCKSLYSTLAFVNIKAIRSRAFQGCSALKTVYISSSFFQLGNDNLPIGIMEEKAFDSCNDNLKFYLVGDSTNINTWKGLNPNWAWKNEYGTTANVYDSEITSAGVTYSNDWIYTVANSEVTIQRYIGPTEIEGESIKFLSFPNELPSGSGQKVRSIALDFLNSSPTVKASVERLYLPKTLKRIESGMFDGDYTNLSVVDDNTKCSVDEALVQGSQSLTPRVVLNGLTDLEIIGNRAFVDMPKLATVTKLYLPYSLKAVGTNAFGSSESVTEGNPSKHMQAVTDFRWDYDDTKSALKVIGRAAFYELGNSSTKSSFTSAPVHQGYRDSSGNNKYGLTTLIIPRTFEHFGITATDKNTYTLGTNESNDASFGISAFAGCPLLSEVIFKGSNTSSATFNLAIPSQTFVMNESLRTVVFEERNSKKIVFHTAGGKYQPAIGWSSGKANNDFGGDPALQTLVLPNKTTTLYIQNFAFQGNSRGAIYLSSTENSKIYGFTTANLPNSNSVTSVSFPTSTTSVVGEEAYKEWRTIGDEGFYNNVCPGYCLATKTNDASTSVQNTYGLNQKMPVYEDIHYQKTFNVNGVSVNVEVGSGNSKELITKDKCDFVCNPSNYTAVMSNYLYDRYDSSFTGTAIVPTTITTSNNTVCTVNEIGPSAFSADYCDTTSYANDTLHKDLTAVLIPDAITKIGEYAFMRAYGVTNLYSYSSDPASPHANYVMPSSLEHIGKHAFAFCNIKQFLNIPTNCLFYENENDTTYETSVFSNDYSLRKITFGNNATSSPYYTTTTYTHGASDTYTSAIYSTADVTYNASSLLLVLNRDNNDKLKPSGDLTSVTVTVNNQSTNYSQFDGQYVNGGYFLYGAFKMCYWLDSLIVGRSGNFDENNNPLNQPLISGVANGTLFYLNNARNFVGYTCNLKSISFGNISISATPPYSFEGCEKLATIRLPRIEGGSIPAGLFASVDNSNIVFEVPDDTTGTSFKTCDPGVLDLQYTGYASIDAEAFKSTKITTLIAPESTQNVTTFTINEDAFGSCNYLTSIDFSHVTGTVILNAAFRKSKVSSSLFNFGSSADIEFGDETFKECKFSDKKFIFPAKTSLIGTSCFEACNDATYPLEEVTATSNLTNLKRVISDNGAGQNNAGNNIGFKQICDYAFYKCTNLKKFDFSKFTDLERIGHYAFSMVTTMSGTSIKNDTQGSAGNSTICENGIVVLPASLTNIGVGAFHSSKITSVTIQSTAMKFERGGIYSSSERCGYNKGGCQFRFCKSLTKVFFTEPDCDFSIVEYLTAQPNNGSQYPYLQNAGLGQENYFADCGNNLLEVYIPSTYDIQYFQNPPESDSSTTAKTLRPDSMLWNSNNNVKVFLYHTLKDCDLTKPFCVYWHRTASGKSNNLYFFVTNNEDIVNINNNYAQWVPGFKFWCLINNTKVELGTVSQVYSDGVVQFSGYYVDSTGVHAGTYTPPQNP